MTRRSPIELPASDLYAWCVRWDGRGWRGELRDDIRIVGRREPSRTVLAAIEMYAPSRAAPGSNGGLLEPSRRVTLQTLIMSKEIVMAARNCRCSMRGACDD